jgi:hemerythrin superfamily protein
VTDVTDVAHRNVVDLLLDQHNQIKELFREVASTRGDRKRELFQDLVRLLAVHETAEELVVHPAARDAVNGGDQVVDRRLHEEDEAKHVLAKLYDMGVDDPRFDAEFANFAQAVVDHATREEQEEFRYLRQNLSEEKLERMAGAVRAAESIAPTRPHPGAGQSPAANLVLGPPAALFDRMRDAVRDWRGSNKD